MLDVNNIKTMDMASIITIITSSSGIIGIILWIISTRKLSKKGSEKYVRANLVMQVLWNEFIM